MTYWQPAPVPRDQLVLFPESLEDRIPEDHPVRLLDEILDTMDWREWEAEYNGEVGQPPIHPSVLGKVVLYGLLRRTRSSRQIEYSLTHNVDFMWLASGRSIDHTTICNFRTKHDKQLRNLYREMNRKAIDLAALAPARHRSNPAAV